MARPDPQQSVVVVGVGARTAVGLTAASAAAAVRAGISRLGEHPTFVDRAEQPNLGLPPGAGQRLTVVPRGSAAGLAAMELASTRLRQGHAEFCLVGGVDSYLFPDTLKWMDAEGMLKSAANRNGFPPGEGAGFCLLCLESTALTWRLPILSWLVSFGLAREDNRIRTNTVCVGRGLSDAIKMATAALQLPEERIDESICDMNGEPYRSAEYSFAAVRTQMAMVSFTRFVTPVDCWGDVGAASGPLFATLAIAAGLRGYARGPRTLLWASSMGGDRAAAILRLSPLPGGGTA